MRGGKLRHTNGSEQTASLTVKAGMTSPGSNLSEGSHPSLEGEITSVKWDKSLSESWLMANQEGSREQSQGQFQGEESEPTTCIWTGLSTLQTGIGQIKRTTFAKGKSNLNQYL